MCPEAETGACPPPTRMPRGLAASHPFAVALPWADEAGPPLGRSMDGLTRGPHYPMGGSARPGRDPGITRTCQFSLEVISPTSNSCLCPSLFRRKKDSASSASGVAKMFRARQGLLCLSQGQNLQMERQSTLVSEVRGKVPKCGWEIQSGLP